VNVYKSWEQVAGYFDGDGNISISDLSNQPFKFSLSVIFTDASPEQIFDDPDVLREQRDPDKQHPTYLKRYGTHDRNQHA